MNFRLAATAGALIAFALPAWADLDLGAVDTCVAEAVAKGEVPTVCVDAAHSACATLPEDVANQAILCFAKARDDWSAGITTRMDRIRAAAPEQIAAVAAVELKYDLLAGLVQCDRMEELAKLTDTPAEAIQRQKARCQATASGLAYIRLTWRSQGLR